MKLGEVKTKIVYCLKKNSKYERVLVILLTLVFYEGLKRS